MTDESGQENQELIIPSTASESELRKIDQTQIVSANEDTVNGTRQHEIDRMEASTPLGFRFSVSGKNASQMFLYAGVIGIILAVGYAASLIIGALP